MPSGNVGQVANFGAPGAGFFAVSEKQEGQVGEAGLLASCYRRCLSLADDLGLRSVVFPCISTGAYGYPATSAAQVAVATVREHGATLCHVEQVMFCCFSAADAAIYQQLLAGSPAL